LKKLFLEDFFRSFFLLRKMKRRHGRLNSSQRKRAKFSPATFVRISGLTTLANSIVCDQCDKLVRGEQMFANEKNAIDLCKSCFKKNTRELFAMAPAFGQVENIPEGEVKNGYYCCWDGDTVSRIARKVNLKVPKIVSMNSHIPDLNGRTRLEAGTVLKVAEGEGEAEVVHEDETIEPNSKAAAEDDSVARYTNMTKAERKAKLKDILQDLCCVKYHPLEEINRYYKELNYRSKESDRAVKIWVLRAKIREELGAVMSYLKSFHGGNKYNVYWDAAENGEKLWYTCFLININFFNGRAELMWEKEDEIIEYNLNHLWLKTVNETEEKPPVVDTG